MAIIKNIAIASAVAVAGASMAVAMPASGARMEVRVKPRAAEVAVNAANATSVPTPSVTPAAYPQYITPAAGSAPQYVTPLGEAAAAPHYVTRSTASAPQYVTPDAPVVQGTSSSAAPPPYVTPVATPGDCKHMSMGSFPLGFDASRVSIYDSNAKTPSYLNTWNTPYDNSGFHIVSWDNASPHVTPQVFEFMVCTYLPAPEPYKGSINKWQGYLKTQDGQCLTVADTGKNIGDATHMQVTPCDFNARTPTGVVENQNFQFAAQTWFDVLDVTFLGAKQAPQTSGFEVGANQPDYRFDEKTAADGNKFLQLTYGEDNTPAGRSHSIVGITNHGWN